MSTNYTTYLGPHVCCKISKVKAPKKIRTCSKATCSQYENQIPLYIKKKFCEQCGSPIEDRNIPIEADNVDMDNTQVLLQDSLCVPGGDYFYSWMDANNTHVWLANRHIPGARNFYSERLEIQYIPITSELMVKEIDQFANFYERELGVLRQEYGKENVKIQWGLIHYIS